MNDQTETTGEAIPSVDSPSGPTPPAERVESPKLNPLLTRRMLNAFARLSGCNESDPAAQCVHRHMARRTMEELIGRYATEPE